MDDGILSNTQCQTKISVKVFYRPEQVAINANGHSPSAYKSKQVVEDWLALGLIDTRDIKSFEPVSRADFKRVHAPQMVDDVLDLKRRNGCRNHDPEVAASLPARCSREHRTRLAASP